MYEAKRSKLGVLSWHNQLGYAGLSQQEKRAGSPSLVLPSNDFLQPIISAGSLFFIDTMIIETI
jgi:hypothetical protein